MTLLLFEVALKMGLTLKIGTGADRPERSQSHFRSRIAQLTGPFIQDQFHAAAAGRAATQQLDPQPAVRRRGLRFDPPTHSAQVGPVRAAPGRSNNPRQPLASADNCQRRNRLSSIRSTQPHTAATPGQRNAWSQAQPSSRAFSGWTKITRSRATPQAAKAGGYTSRRRSSTTIEPPS